MSVAYRVEGVECVRLEWILVRDEDGVGWRYCKQGGLDTEAPAQVECSRYGGTLIVALTLDDQGDPFLRQEAPGLPDRIVVEHVEPGCARQKHEYVVGRNS